MSISLIITQSQQARQLHSPGCSSNIAGARLMALSLLKILSDSRDPYVIDNSGGNLKLWRRLKCRNDYKTEISGKVETRISFQKTLGDKKNFVKIPSCEALTAYAWLNCLSVLNFQNYHLCIIYLFRNAIGIMQCKRQIRMQYSSFPHSTGICLTIQDNISTWKDKE